MSERRTAAFIVVILLSMFGGTAVTATLKALRAASAAEVHVAQAYLAGLRVDSLSREVGQIREQAAAFDTATMEREVAFALERDSLTRAIGTLETLAAKQDSDIGEMVESLDAEVRIAVQPILDSLGARVKTSELATAAAMLRASNAEVRADSLLLWGTGFKSLSELQDEENWALRLQVGSLQLAVGRLQEASDYSLWILPEARWWMVPVALGVGYIAAGG
tara:strand:- start:2444 stop:3106 length:663 start_codon:yes stop_codon:yes gene_type:complete